MSSSKLNPSYSDYHWWFTNVLLSCPWAGGVFRLLMTRSFTLHGLNACTIDLTLDTYGIRAWRRAVETVLVPMLLRILSTSSSSSRRAISSLVVNKFWSTKKPQTYEENIKVLTWSWQSRWWWRQVWGGTGVGSWRPGSPRRGCPHPRQGTWAPGLKYTHCFFLMLTAGLLIFLNRVILFTSLTNQEVSLFH